MKSLFAAALLTLVYTSAFAQPEVTKAYNANRAGDFASAAEYIEQALGNPKANTKEKTWRYRATIYYNIATDSLLSTKFPDALQRSADSYRKAMAIDTKGSYARENKQGLENIRFMAGDVGAGLYNDGDFGGAAKMFDMALSMASDVGIVDTVIVFNAALSHEKAGNKTEAIAGYLSCADIGYNVPRVYLFAANIHKANADTVSALQLLQAARETHPRDQTILIEELNIYLTAGDFDKALENLRVAAEQDPTNEILFFSMGSVNDNLGNFEDAERAYKQAIAISPGYFDANYNLGALYFNKGVAKVKSAEDVSDNTKYQALKAEADVYFESALPYLEKAHEVNPTDPNTMRSLQDVYARKGMDDKFMEMNAKLKAATGN